MFDRRIFKSLIVGDSDLIEKANVIYETDYTITDPDPEIDDEVIVLRSSFIFDATNILTGGIIHSEHFTDAQSDIPSIIGLTVAAVEAAFGITLREETIKV